MMVINITDIMVVVAPMRGAAPILANTSEKRTRGSLVLAHGLARGSTQADRRLGLSWYGHTMSGSSLDARRQASGSFIAATTVVLYARVHDR